MNSPTPLGHRFGPFLRSVESSWNSIYAQSPPYAVIEEVALRVLIQMPLLFLATQPCILGLFTGLRFDEEAAQLASRINRLYALNVSGWRRKCLLGAAGLFALIALPASLTVAAFCCSTQWGAALHRYAVANKSPLKTHLTAPEWSGLLQRAAPPKGGGAHPWLCELHEETKDPVIEVLSQEKYDEYCGTSSTSCRKLSLHEIIALTEQAVLHLLPTPLAPPSDEGAQFEASASLQEEAGSPVVEELVLALDEMHARSRGKWPRRISNVFLASTAQYFWSWLHDYPSRIHNAKTLSTHRLDTPSHSLPS